MAIGMNPRKKGLFGRNIPFPATPGIGDGDPRLPQNDPAPGLGMRNATPEPEKPGFLGQGGVGRAIIGNVADAISQYYGGMPVYAQGMAERQREEQARQQAAAKMRERSLDMAEWDYKQRNEVPTIQRNAEYIRQTQGEDAASEYVRNYGQRPEEPRMVNIPGVGSYFGTMSEIQQMLGRGGSQGSGNIPRVTDEASYSALPPGSKFYDDEGNLRTKSGGPSQPATGGF